MATYYPRYYFYDSVGMASSEVKPVYHSRLVDFSTVLGATGVTTSDAVNMLAVPAYTQVLGCNYQTVTTVTDATSSFAITANTANIVYVTAAVAVASGLFGVPAAISASTAQKWFAVKDDIQIKSVTVASLLTGQIRVFATMLYPQPISYVDVDGNTKTTTFTDRNNWTVTAPVIP